MDTRESAFVLGQRRTLAAMALGLALLSFLNLAGLEKAILAIVLGLKALSAAPPPALEQRRGWARLAIGLAAAHVVLVVTVMLLTLDRLASLLDALRAMSDLR
jgi:hypothetical protein